MMAAGQMFIWAAILYSFPATLLIWEADLGWSRSDLTLGFAIAIFASAAISPIVGRMVDQGYGPIVMGWGTVLAGGCLILLTQAQSLGQFYMAWGLIGLTQAATLYDVCFAIVTRAHGAQAKQRIVAITILAGLAGTISFPLVSWLAGVLGWRLAFQVIGIAVILFLAPLQLFGAFYMHLEGEDDVPPASVSKNDFLKSPRFWILGLAFATIALTHGAILGHLLPLLAERGVPTWTAVTFAAAVGPMQVVGRLALMASGDRLGSHGQTIVSFTMVTVAALILLYAGTGVTLLAVFVAFFGAGYGLTSILRPVIARDVLGQTDFGAKAGSLATIYLLAAGSAPYLGARLWQVGGYDLMLMVLIALSVLGLTLYGFARRG